MTPETKARWIAAIGSTVVRILLFTLRFQIEDRGGALKGSEKPLIWLFWHNRLLVVPYLFERYFPGCRGTALTSASKDGELLAAFLRSFGVQAVRGSSSRGGGRALVEMKRALDDGFIVAITPDGPRGPCYQLAPGVVKLAQISGSFILPLHITYSRYWQLKSWDRFMIPKPFAKVTIVLDKWCPVPDTENEADFERERVRLEQLLKPAEPSA